MKKFALMALLCVATITSLQAALTDEQKEVRKEMLDKYDTNKDGKLDKEERSKMTDDDKAKYMKAFPRHKKKDADSTTPAPDAPSTTPPPAAPAAPETK